MMMFTVHLGSFLGPLLGGIMVDFFNYRGFLQLAAAGTACSAMGFMWLSRKSEKLPSAES